MTAVRTFRLGLLLFGVVAMMPVATLAQAPSSNPTAPRLRDGARDFDFEIGTWKSHLRRLIHPLSGSSTWVE